MSELSTGAAPIASLDDFDYELPPECIAQEPAARRDQARLLVMDRVPVDEPADDASPGLSHHRVSDLAELLRADDLLVVNATRVLPARLLGCKPTGGAVEALLLGETRASERSLPTLSLSTSNAATISTSLSAYPPSVLFIRPGILVEPSSTSLYLYRPWTSDEAQLPAPIIATLILPKTEPPLMTRENPDRPFAFWRCTSPLHRKC